MTIPVPVSAEALIFDLDGTLADSMPVHLAAWQNVGARFGFQYTQQDLDQYAGMSSKNIVGIINQRDNLNLDAEEIAYYKEQYFIQNLDKVTGIVPVVKVFEKYNQKCPIAVGTGSFRHVAQQILANIGIDGNLKTLVTADDVKRHKPAPDTFLECARQLDVQPEKCIVFEDAELGFQAARAAKMVSIDVRKYY